MMLKAIFAKHVWSGDSILLSGGERVEVERIEPGTMNFILKGGGRICLKEHDIVGLGHRSWPEGTTERDVKTVVWDRVAVLSRLLRGAGTDEERLTALKSLHEAIETYELGLSGFEPKSLKRDGVAQSIR